MRHVHSADAGAPIGHAAPGSAVRSGKTDTTPTVYLRRHHVGFLSAALLLGSVASQAAHAQAGSFTISTGAAIVMPQSRSGLLETSIGGRAMPQLTDRSLTTRISPTATAALTFAYFVTDHIAVEMAAGIPPVFNIMGTGSASQYGKLGEARQWAPTVLAKYYFGKPTDKLRPSVGLGLNYTWFTGARITNAAFTQRLGGPRSVSVASGFAPVFNAGLTYNVTQHWFVGASVSFMPMSRTITLKSANGNIVSKSRTQMNPVVAFLNVGYKF